MSVERPNAAAMTGGIGGGSNTAAERFNIRRRGSAYGGGKKHRKNKYEQYSKRSS